MMAMPSPSLRTLLKWLVVLLILAVVGPYVIGNVLFQPSSEQLMAQHFKKASVYNQGRNNDKLPHAPKTASPLRHHPNVARVPGGVRSLDNTIPPHNNNNKNNRWRKPNDQLQQSDQQHSAIYIPLNETCSARNYTSYQTQSYCLPDDVFDKYFLTGDGEQFCLRSGTEFFSHNGTKCHCKIRWHGTSCSMPDIVYKSNYPREFGYKYQNPPRRLIHAFPFTYEFDLLEMRFHEYGDLVDLYVIIESNYTASGQPKKRHLKNRLDKGEFKDYSHKILYVPLSYFPRQAFYNGWVIDALLRNYMAEAGLSRIQNLRPDDVFLLTDADELPRKELLMFLKLHMSYPEPVGMYLSHNVYGFNWLGEDVMTHVFGACSMSMLAHVFKWQPYALRSATKSMQLNAAEVTWYRYKKSGRVRSWSAGNGTAEGAGREGRVVPEEDVMKALEVAAGWHCSWCFPPAGIKAKLEAAHWSDLPRWGAYPSKTSEAYIKNLTETGTWFDDRTKLIPSKVNRAPGYILKNAARFKHLLGSEYMRLLAELEH